MSDEAGEKRATVYLALLRGHTDAALEWMVREACRRFDWLPTPKQCIDLLGEYRAPTSDRSIALRLCGEFVQDQLNRWFDNVRDGQPLGDVPDQWLRIGVEQGVVRRLADGTFVSRALFVGPFMPLGGVQRDTPA